MRYEIALPSGNCYTQDYDNDIAAIVDTFDMIDFGPNGAFHDKYGQDFGIYIDKVNEDGELLEENWAYIYADYNEARDYYTFTVETDHVEPICYGVDEMQYAGRVMIGDKAYTRQGEELTDFYTDRQEIVDLCDRQLQKLERDNSGNYYDHELLVPYLVFRASKVLDSKRIKSIYEEAAKQDWINNGKRNGRATFEVFYKEVKKL